MQIQYLLSTPPNKNIPYPTINKIVVITKAILGPTLSIILKI